MSDEMKLCPFCGCALKKLRDIAFIHPDESGEDCVLSGRWFGKLGIASWNTRPIEDKLTAELTAARAEIERLTAGLMLYADQNNWFDEDGNRRYDDIFCLCNDGWEAAQRILLTPPSPASAPESGQDSRERQTDSLPGVDGVGEVGK